MAHPCFEILQSSINYKYFFRLRSLNKEIVLSSLEYDNRETCLEGVNLTKKNALSLDQYDLGNTTKEFSFNLLDEKGKMLGKSGIYPSKADRDHRVRLIQLISQIAEVI